ncbi:Endoglucanase-4 [Pestalotiopsis fici W106-1]|uniref:lytic cellulose monooxygenase (C4-dehydrogenating) n=1 Tax=Pestalotiopsis fici (strain W106-1 / CGMCC3.15140) TaxID=1229662 RepID=W3XJ05_PESFW|nr:Endoglucanase-4 [Pestalotiopsis fici W106-1]ETS86000.1 Endoglucanase-4 [Pestalotiopsis fici W106-1]
MASSKFSALLALAAGAGLVSAHGYVSLITVDGVEYQGYPPSSAPYENPAVDRIAWSDSATDNGYVAPDAYASGDIICHRDGSNAALTATAAAGSTVSFQWNTWPDSHKGPVINYMASCNGDCTTVDKTSLEFFKIAESGLIEGSSSGGTWASDELISNNYTQSITIPSTLAAGNYVLRHEIIALHSAGSEDGAQNYPQCFNIEVTGSGSESPAGTLGEALYSEDDAGILINIYTSLASYDIPGPTLAFADSGSAAATTVAAAAEATTTAAATSAAATTSTKAAATTSSSTSSAAAVSKTSSCKKRRHARDVVKN